MKHLFPFDNFLVEKIVKISDDFQEKAKEAFTLIKDNKERWAPMCGDEDHPYFPIQFRNFFEINNMKGERIKVHMGVYNSDPEEHGIASIDTSNVFPTVLINLKSIRSIADFIESIEHELIHIMDPKVMDRGLSDRMWNKYGTEDTSTEIGLRKYHKSPWEFDAYSTNIINHIKRRLETSKPIYRKKIWELMSIVPKMTPMEIISDDNWQWCVVFLSGLDRDDDSEEAYEIAYSQLDCLKSWTERPTLWRRFLQRLYTEIGK